jgi:membrane-associated phospholipid phosphatase
MVAISALNFFVIGLSIHFQINIIYTIASLVLLTGIIASSRLYMRAHTQEELTVGYLCGVVPQLCLWYFWL